MCGIAGYKNLLHKQEKIDDILLQNMQKSMPHRGPDAFGTWKSEPHQIGFAHRRLSIIDLSDAGKQPMLNKEKDVVICFNGEIYNHETLKKELINKGYTYRSKTDTETILHAYKEWGIDCINKLEGMFAIALFDLKKNELFLVRDRIGIKPLYFSTQGNKLSFASEIKALEQLPWVKKNLSSTAYWHYLTFMVTPAPYTIFENIYKLPAGFYAKVDAHNNLTFHEWYNPVQEAQKKYTNDFSNETFCIEGIRSLLKASTKKRMICDVPFGAFLSGGIDSSLNVALMAHEIGKVKTFTVSFEHAPETNELKWARLIANKFDTDHHEITISEKKAFDFYQDMIYHLDEPLADPVCVPFYFVAKLAKESGVTVAQVGEGSDELFFGYDLYAKYHKVYRQFWKPTQHLPNSLKKLLFHGAKPFTKNKSHIFDLLHNWANHKNLFWGGAIAFNQTFKKEFYKANKYNINTAIVHEPIVSKIYNGLQQHVDSHNIVDYHTKKLLNSNPNADFIQKMTYLELKQRLPELLLMRADKMAMATSLEARVPFLDHNLVEFALNIPSHIKFKNNTTKYILKKACEGVIPNEIIYRKKVGFAAPTMHWFNHGKHFPKYFKTLLGDVKNLSTNNHINSVQKWVLQNYKTLEEHNEQ